MIWRQTAFAAASVVAASFLGGAALADSIDPTSYSADLAVGEKVTITKTVTVAKAGPTDAVLDVMFLIDTTGSMGGAIANAKSAASSILDGLRATYGPSLKSGVGFYNDPDFDGVNSDLSADDTPTKNTLNGYFASGGGDYPELGNSALKDAADNASWRPGSNRFVIVLGDAPFKKDICLAADFCSSDSETQNDAAVQASVDAKGINLIGLDFGSDNLFDNSILGFGGSVYAGGASPTSIVDAIKAGVAAGFAEYSEVTVGDLGGGLPGISVSTKCLTADIGTCIGADAIGSYDRSKDRTFTYEVTFERLASGDSVFDTHALVDGGIVASERDSFRDGGLPPVPLPAAGWLMLAGIGSLAAARRRKA